MAKVICPQCGRDMRLIGGEFWGCTGYPKDCKKTLSKAAARQYTIAEPGDESKAKKSFVPSKYQQAVFDTIINIDSQPSPHTVIEACAGSGKTTTQVQAIYYIPNRTNQRVISVAFARNIAETLAERLPPDAESSTTHSAAFKDVRAHLGYTPKIDEYKVRNIAACLLPDYLTGPAAQLIDKIKNTLASTDAPTLDQLCDRYDIDIAAELREDASDDEIEEARYKIYSVVPTILERDLAETTTIDFTDMLWLPVYGNWPIRQFDWLMGDEVQDWNAGQIEWAMRAAGHSHIVAVGDARQCVIDGTMISVYNSIPKDYDFRGENMLVEDITQNDSLVTAIGNGRFWATKPSNSYSHHVVDADVVTITTKSGKSLTTTPEHVYFADFINGQSKNKYYTYLMLKDGNFRIGMASWYHYTKNKDKSNEVTLIPGFKGRGSSESADAMWILEICDSSAEARYYEEYYSIVYGIPTWLYRIGNRRIGYTDELITRLFSEVDTYNNGLRLLAEKKYDFNRPHYSPKCMVQKRRRNFGISLCGDARAGGTGLSRFAISGSDDNDKQKLIDVGLKPRPSKGKKGWRIESVYRDVGEIYRIFNLVHTAFEGEVNLVERAAFAKIGQSTLRFMPASQVLPGMFVFTEQNGEIVLDEVVSRVYGKYTGMVHDFDVDRSHNYIANGIVVHNSIFGFRGADSNAMTNVTTRLNAQVLPLSICYRCPKSHIELAQQIVPEIEPAPNAIEGTIGWLKQYELAYHEQKPRGGDLVLCRVNAPLVSYAYAFMRQGIKVTMRGRKLGEGIVALIRKLKPNSLEELAFKARDYYDKEHAKLMKKGLDGRASALTERIETLLALMEGVDNLAQLLRLTESMFNDNSRDGIVFSTVHRAKGDEADRVFILRPDLMPHPKAKGEEQLLAEQNIKYVATTRSKNELWFVEK